MGKIPALEYLLEDVMRAEVDRGKSIRDLIDRPEAHKLEGYCRKKIRLSEYLDSF